jgi:7-carboxy-7-deazaguanine synthase
MLFAELIPLAEQLRRRQHHITVETAGTLYLPVECDLMSISPKLAGSAPAADQEPRWSVRHERSRHVPEVVRRLAREYEYQCKFIIDQPADVDAVERYLEEIPEISGDRVWLMPQGTDREELARKAPWIEACCADRGWKFCPRKQIEWFGLRRGT